MAGDWIKMRCDLDTDPAVIRVGRMTGLDTFAVVGRLHALWAWADRHTGDGSMDGVLVDDVDARVDAPGFARALAAVGWLVYTDDGIRLPHFSRHMGSGSKARVARAQRQKRWRDKKREAVDGKRLHVDVYTASTETSTGRLHVDGVDRLEKRREENTNTYCSEPEAPASEPETTEPAEPPVMTFPTVGTGAKEWHLTAAKLAEYATSFPGLDVQAECRKALQWLRDNPGKRKTAKGMPRFLGSWLGRANDRGPRGPALFDRAPPAPDLPRVVPGVPIIDKPHDPEETD